MTKVKHYFKTCDKNFWGLLAMLLAILIALYIGKGDKFYTPQNLLSIGSQFPQFGVMSLGMMLAMILGGIDLSIVGLANLATIVSGVLLKRWIVPGETTPGEAAAFIVAAILLALLIGAVGGSVNGFLISRVGIPAILATLGTQQLYTGLCIVITKGSAVSGIPQEFKNIGSFRLFGVIPLPLIVFIICAAAVSFILTKTAFGKRIYLLGTNRKAAIYSGLHEHRITISTYAISGFLASVGGLLMMARMGSAKADYGSSYVMQCILIVVLGGVSPSGGFGNVKGVVLAIFILQVISSGLNMFPSISSYYKQLIWGAVLLLVMVVRFIMAHRSHKKGAKSKKAVTTN